MKKIIISLIGLLLFIPLKVDAQVNMYLFYGKECPHCSALEEYLDDYLSKNDDVTLYKYEVWYDKENQNKLIDVKEILDSSASGVPFLVIGNNVISGYSEDYTDEEIVNTVNYYRNNSYSDKVGVYLGVVSETDNNDNKYTSNNMYVSIFGKKIDTATIGVTLSSALIGLVDGFNPCAMWILIFLISMLIGMNNKKRMWALGLAFLFTSAFIYLLFILSILNISIFLNKIIYIRLIISVIAIVLGTYQILSFIKSFNKDTGCEVVDLDKRKKIIKKIKNIIKEKSFILALLGIIFLAVSVNIIELMCSLGLPLMFSEILTLNNVSGISKLFYALIYMLFFMLDDIIVFFIAMKTLEIKVISNKYGKYSHLIGGIIMIIIGILLVTNPGILTFNF